MSIERKSEIKRRRHRKTKIRKLRGQISQANNKAEKEKLISKLRRVSRTAPVE